jgi:DNA topoisomerase I
VPAATHPATTTRKPRLRRSDCSGPGIRRVKRGRGFGYVDEGGRRVSDPEEQLRIRELAIPPAWREVWICPDAAGHLQATGVDAAGRKQYLYHRRWRELQDQKKFDRTADFARALPRLRRRIAADLGDDELRETRVSRARSGYSASGCSGSGVSSTPTRTGASAWRRSKRET